MVGSMSTGRHRKRNPRRRAFLLGVGSLMDLRGEATYREMREMMPEPEPSNLNTSLLRATRSMGKAVNT